MNDWIIKQALDHGFSDKWADYTAFFIVSLVIVLAAMVVYKLSKFIVLKLIAPLIVKTKIKWDDVFLEQKVFHRAVLLVPAVVVYLMSPMLVFGGDWAERIAVSMMVLGILLTVDRLLRVVNVLYQRKESSKNRPITGFLQIIRIVLYITGIIVIISVFFDRSPLLFLGGLGAASAVLILVFQNTILGFVSGIQLTENDMVRIGDWVEIPGQNADGAVTEISLYSVKVQNWDKTITTVPTYSLITNSFINWRGMNETGGRRIKRSISIDIGSVKFCTDEMLERFSKIQYITEYLDKKKEEIDEYNISHEVDDTSEVNGRRLTNIGTFRAYIRAYLANHPRIHPELITMVRQLQPDDAGVPIEIYTFTATTAWVEYENIQADIFDHIFAVAPKFDLRIFQKPTGYDFSYIGK